MGVPRLGIKDAGPPSGRVPSLWQRPASRRAERRVEGHLAFLHRQLRGAKLRPGKGQPSALVLTAAAEAGAENREIFLFPARPAPEQLGGRAGPPPHPATFPELEFPPSPMPFLPTSWARPWRN